MDFSVIFQLRTKKFWWMDVIFYFMISLLIATVLCWLIFLIKDVIQQKEINNEIAALKTVGTDDQKAQESEVINYHKKIDDFSNLLENHQFASNVFAFMEAQTMPNIWFKQFSLDEKDNAVQLSGESDDMDSFSRQVATLEKNQYVKNIGTLNSTLGNYARIEFNINLVLDPSIFSYLSAPLSISQTTTSSEQSEIPSGTSTGTQTSPTAGGQQSIKGTLSSEKLITSFHLLLNPEVTGLVNETNYTITLNVPNGTDVKNLIPSIVISPGATVSPVSDAPQDFTSPVTYTVTAEDGSTQNYGVKVIVAAPSQVVNKSSQSGFTTIIIIILVAIIIAALVVLFLFFWKKRQVKKTKP